MKLYSILFILFFYGQLLFSQVALLPKQQVNFNSAYLQAPKVPKGVLEAVAWSNTRMTHLISEEVSCSGMPSAFGIMGLFDDGKGYFKENAKLVALLSGISVSEQKQSPNQQILAYAKALNILIELKQNNDPSKPRDLHLKESLLQLSEIPDSGKVNLLARDMQLYQIFRFLNDSQKAVQYDFPVHSFDLELIFGKNNLKVLSAKRISFTPTAIISDEGDVYTPMVSSNGVIIEKGPDYGPAIWNPAPTCNFSSRNGTAISAVTIHTTQGSYAGSISWSQNCVSDVSFHYIIRSSDGQVTQMVLEADKAWHVGSENPYTIGIEHEGYVSDPLWYTPAMYQASADLSRDITNSGYGIPPLRTYYGPSSSGLQTLGGCTKIKGHQHYPNQSHTDPGIHWDWEKYYKLINNTYTPTLITNASGAFYDTGGASGNYQDDERELWLFGDANASNVTLNFTAFDLELNYDYMFIYDGDSVNSPLIGVYNGTTSPGTIVSTGSYLLVEFRSDCGTTNPGWEANYTINYPVEVSFSQSTSNITESNTTVNFEVGLSLTSTQNVSVDYTVTGTATSGADYLLSNGTVTIPSGNTSVNITANILDDALVENSETIIITLSNPVNATLGAITTHTHIILDDESNLNFGYTGPGGVGDSVTNKLWLMPDGVSNYSDGADITSWLDNSGNGNDVLQSNTSYTPRFYSNIINGYPVVRFEQAEGRLIRNNFSDFPTTEITTFHVNKTSDAGDGLLSYASSAGSNDYLIYGSESLIIYHGGFINSSIATNDNNFHIVSSSWRNYDGLIEIWKDNSLAFTSYGFQTGTSITPGGCLAIGGEQDGIDSAYDPSQFHQGDFSEIIIYNDFLNSARNKIVSNYLSSKYGLLISNDLYAYDAQGTFEHEVAGIGRDSLSSFHNDAKGQAIVRINTPSSLDDGDFLLWGHNNGSMSIMENSDIPLGVEYRMERVWKADQTGDVGNVSIHFDLTGLPIGNNTDLVLLIDSDGGTFINAAQINLSSYSGNIATFDNVYLSDGDRFTIAKLSTANVYNIGMDTHFSVYPNPTSSKVKVISSQKDIENLQLHDIRGRKVKVIIHYISKKEVELDLSNLVKGAYYIKVGRSMIPVYKK